MQNDAFLLEAKRLWDLGLGCHWLKAGSKAPVKANWSAPTRDDWEIVERDYRKEYGLGVRLGAASRCVDGGFLANIDVDIKSADPLHRSEALAFLEKKFPGIKANAPWVKTGYGYRYFVRTAEPVASGKLGASNEESRVLMPTAEVGKRQHAVLTKEELAAGWRVRPAWELELMSAGKQVVLPPSIHPDTGNAYLWGRPFKATSELPFIDTPTGKYTGTKRLMNKGTIVFEPVDVDLIGDCGLSDRIVDMILSGQGVENRSDALMSVMIAMVKARWNDNQILSVLTDRTTFLGETAFEHRKTDNRQYAAAWLRDHTLEKVKQQTLAEHVFRNEVVITEPLSPEAAAAQKAEALDDRSWKDSLKRTGPKGNGGYQSTLNNVIKILTGTYGDDLFKLDEFSGYHVYGQKAPWGKEVGEEFSDRERPIMLAWLAKEFGIEPKVNIIFDAVAVIAARNPFHPIKDYLEALVWDGTPRIDTWLKRYMRAHDVEEGYLTEVSRKVLVAMVARAYEPGCQFDYMLVLKGAQGVKKSSALRILAGDKYFTSTVLDPTSKDTILKMSSKWLMEFGELSNINKDVKALKNFITMRVDRDRMPFDRLAADYPRKCIFVGTTNEDDFIYDHTGGRRFWPVSVGEVDLKRLVRDRNQLMAEAKAMYDCCEPLYLSIDAEAEARDEQAKWAPEDALIDDVRLVLERNLVEKFFPSEGFKLFDVMSRMEGRNDLQTQKRVGNCLRKLDYWKKNKRVDGKQRTVWFSKAFLDTSNIVITQQEARLTLKAKS